MHRTRYTLAYLLACLFFVACNTPPGGLGLGRPEFSPSPGAALTPVAITQVYAPTGNLAASFVQLENRSGAVIDFDTTRLTMVSAWGTLDIGQANVVGGDTSRKWAAGARRAIALTDALQVHPSNGALAVVSQGGIIQGSASWGAPDAKADDLASQNSASGVPVAKASASLPFPMPSSAAVNLDPNVKSVCVTPDANAQQAAQTSCDSSAVLALSRVAPGAFDPNGGYVEVLNTSGASVDIYGLQVCTPNCQTVHYYSNDASAPIGVLAPQARVVIEAGTPGADAEGFIGSEITAPAPQGEVFLLRPGAPAKDFAASDMVAYVGYALNGNAALLPNAQVATNAGLWNAGAVVVPVTVSGEALTLKNAPSEWVPSTSAPKSMPSFATWESCSYPLIDAPKAAAVIAEVANTTPPRLRIVGRAAADISGYTLVLGDSAQPIALSAAKKVDLAGFTQGSQLWVELAGASTCTTLNHLCTNAIGDLGHQEATLKDQNGDVVFHVQWGPDVTSLNGSSAQGAGAWPLETCRARPLGRERALKLIDTRSGRGAGDFSVGYPTFF